MTGNFRLWAGPVVLAVKGALIGHGLGGVKAVTQVLQSIFWWLLTIAGR